MHQIDKWIKNLEGYATLSNEQQSKVPNIHTKKMMFWPLPPSSGRASMGSSLAIFFSINDFRRFHIKLAQRHRAKQQF